MAEAEISLHVMLASQPARMMKVHGILEGVMILGLGSCYCAVNDKIVF